MIDDDRAPTRRMGQELAMWDLEGPAVCQMHRKWAKQLGLVHGSQLLDRHSDTLRNGTGNVTTVSRFYQSTSQRSMLDCSALQTKTACLRGSLRSLESVAVP